MDLSAPAGDPQWRRLRARLSRGLVFRVAAVVTSTTAVFLSGAYVNESGFFGESVNPVLQENLRIVPHVIAGIFSRADRLSIDIKQIYMDRLREQRSQALRTGILMKQGDDRVPASIRWGDRTIKVGLRLKGDWTDHLETEKWSFRITVRGGDTLFGMRELSVQHPQTRNYINEWIYLEALRREDVVALRYEFVNVVLNGKDLGIYALEEHFDKLLIEANRRREGPILKFNEETLWADRREHGLEDEQSPTDLQSWFSSTIDAFNMKRIQEDRALQEQFVVARTLLERFRTGELQTRQVFDVPKMANYFALSDLLGANHGAGLWHNLRFYFNPVTARLEPIGFDGDAGWEVRTLLIEEGNRVGDRRSFYTLIFADEMFAREYVRALERVSEPAYLEALFDDLRAPLADALAVLYSEWPSYHFDAQVFHHNREHIRNALRPARALTAAARSLSPDSLELELASIQIMPVEVLGAWHEDQLRFEPGAAIVLPGKRRGSPPEWKTVALRSRAPGGSPEAAPGGLKVRYRILGATESREEEVAPVTPAGDDCAWTRLTQSEGNAKAFSFLTVDDHERTILIKPGTWSVQSSVVVPAGYTLVCGPGTHLDLTRSAMVLSYSPLRCAGTEENPVIVSSSDGTGQGLTVLGAKDTSILSRMTFSGLASPGNGACGLLGGVNFYESPVEMSHLQFEGSRSEDALNLVRSRFQIDDVVFKDTRSDALDIDFGTGSVTRATFLNCGNDAMDVSGTSVSVEDVFIDGAGDKGLSAGEASRMIVRRARVRRAEIGLASKDLSELEIRGLDLAGSSLGFAVYKKKPEFGPAVLSAWDVRTSDLGTRYLLEGGSRLSFEGREVEPNEGQVRDLLYGVKFGKASQ